MKLVSKPNFSNVVSKKIWFKETKDFFLPIFTKSFLVLNFSVTSSKSKICLPDSLIHLLATYAVC